MAGDNVYKSDSIAQEVAAGKSEVPLDLNSSKATLKNFTGETDQGSAGKHGVSNPPSSCYNYYYPGYNGSYSQLDEHGYFHANGSNAGVHSASDNGSVYYYVPSYSPYPSGAIMGVDGQGIGQQQYYSSPGYPQQPVSYGSEALSCYSWDPTFNRDVPTNGKSSLSSSGLAKSFNPTKSMNGKPLFNTQPIKSSSKVPRLGSDFSAGLLKRYSQVGQLPTFTSQKHSLSGFPTYKPYSARGNDRFKERNSRDVDFEASAEITRGPRSRRALSDSPAKKEEAGLFSVLREQYNVADFQTNLEKGKFYVIKSYSEDDIHKSLKYCVWASTPNGNKKFDTVFREVDAQTCPIFLFFSVNGSGQFVGVAEMIGQVDFDKDMEFWQVDKWNGFFPVRWHIVKDVPNSQLRHITLENNENKPVTFTRDAQEVGLKQGIEMLNIFKSYTEKTSLFDDFGFYENREKCLEGKRSIKPAATLKTVEANSAALLHLTKNLSLNCTA